MAPNISVIICTHNPRRDYLERALNALKAQTLSMEHWELLLIDNASDEPLVKNWDLSWHPHARHIREEDLGLTPARLCGIRESLGEWLLFIDDDNVLRRDYLSNAVQIIQENHLIGALGAGRILPEFEITPKPEVVPFVKYLALRNESHAHYSNEVGFNKHIPYGAGLCVARRFAQLYSQSCLSNSYARTLGRKGNELLGCEDVDLVFNVCSNEYIAGTTPQLELLHLIPSFRTETDYLIRIAAGTAKSFYHLYRIWKLNPDVKENPVWRWRWHWKSRLRLKGLGLRIFLAEQKAIKEAREFWQHNPDIK